MSTPSIRTKKSSIVFCAAVIISAIGYLAGAHMAKQSELPPEPSQSPVSIEKTNSPVITSELGPNDFTEEIPPELIRNSEPIPE